MCPDQLFSAEEESQKKQQFGKIQELLRESNSLREELHNLRCLTQIKAEERGQKHRELLRAEVQSNNTHYVTFKISFDVVISRFRTQASRDMHISHINAVKTSKRNLSMFLCKEVLIASAEE